MHVFLVKAREKCNLKFLHRSFRLVNKLKNVFDIMYKLGIICVLDNIYLWRKMAQIWIAKLVNCFCIFQPFTTVIFWMYSKSEIKFIFFWLQNPMQINWKNLLVKKKYLPSSELNEIFTDYSPVYFIDKSWKKILFAFLINFLFNFY